MDSDTQLTFGEKCSMGGLIFHRGKIWGISVGEFLVWDCPGVDS